jgi:hypothetical protein
MICLYIKAYANNYLLKAENVNTQSVPGLNPGNAGIQSFGNLAVLEEPNLRARHGFTTRVPSR